MGYRQRSIASGPRANFGGVVDVQVVENGVQVADSVASWPVRNRARAAES
jgi:hypothetical protein